MGKEENIPGSILLVGSSAGGVPIVEELLNGLERDRTSVLVAQHMPPGYTEQWSERLDNNTPFQVKEAESGDIIEPGKAFIAPGNRHIVLSQERDYSIEINDNPHVNLFRPSIDVLFESALIYPPGRIIPVILSGMCSDGVRSMLKLRAHGCETIAQDEKTSPVYGMNREAAERGAAVYIMSPTEIIEFINSRKSINEPGSGKK